MNERELAMDFAVRYCQTNVDKNLIVIAEQIYQFLMKKDDKEEVK